MTDRSPERVIEELRAELEAARKGQGLLQVLLDHAPDFIAHVTIDGHFLFLNRFAPGLTQADIADSTIYDFLAPETRDMVRAAIAQVVATSRGGDYESIAIGPNRQPTPYYTRVAPVIQNGVVESLVLIATDVTKLKQAEQARAESEAQLQHVLRATKTGTWWWDFDRMVGGRDELTAQLLGIDLEAEDAGVLQSFVHPDDRAAVRQAYAVAATEGTFGPLEHRVIRRDGSVRWVSSSGRVIDGPHGRRLIGGVRDVTEHRLLELQLAQAQKLESIGRLAGGIAHDFNNMLTVISSNTELALRKVADDSALHRDLTGVRLAAERSAALTAQLLAFARKQATEPQIAQLDEIVHRIDELLRRILGRKVEMVVQLGAARPVRIDVSQFEQVLLNLTTNARDAMPQGGRLTLQTSDVKLEASDLAAHPGAVPGMYVRLRVADTGEGIRPADLEHIFEPFFTTKEAGLGTGLGLATCYGIVAQSGGFMNVTSVVGEGTVFDAFLPSNDA